LSASGGIPASLREKYKLLPDREVKFELDEDGIWIIPLVTKKEIQANIGFLRIKGTSLLKALREEKRRKRVLKVYSYSSKYVG
jgi:bifunctional DNA-binding transcriptional regulator/antitoxin component of YhaV-PrlF toxin-antitoxin module